MHQLLIIKTFKKVKDEEEKATGIRPSTTAAAKIFSDYILETQKISFGERSLADYYRMSKKEDNGEVLVKHPKVVQAMCTYLGYGSFKDFKRAHGITSSGSNTDMSNTNKIIALMKKNKILVIVSSAIIIILLLIYSVTKQRWMVWNNDRYVEIHFDTEKYNLGQLKIYNEDRIKNFKKVPVDCNTDFLDPTGKVKIWYGKNIDKELEFFTSLGMHPETGKTLDPITNYMINKYICPKK